MPASSRPGREGACSGGSGVDGARDGRSSTSWGARIGVDARSCSTPGEQCGDTRAKSVGAPSDVGQGRSSRRRTASCGTNGRGSGDGAGRDRDADSGGKLGSGIDAFPIPGEARGAPIGTDAGAGARSGSARGGGGTAGVPCIGALGTKRSPMCSGTGAGATARGSVCSVLGGGGRHAASSAMRSSRVPSTSSGARRMVGPKTTCRSGASWHTIASPFHPMA